LKSIVAFDTFQLFPFNLTPRCNTDTGDTDFFADILSRCNLIVSDAFASQVGNPSIYAVGQYPAANFSNTLKMNCKQTVSNNAKKLLIDFLLSSKTLLNYQLI